MSIAVGDKAPAFSLKDQNGIERCLNNIGEKALVLFFYPKDDTPGCTIEACSFRDQYATLQQLGAEVWGVSGDGATSHRRFAERHQLPYPLLVDEQNKLRQQFGVPNSLILLPGRVTYVIDKNKIVKLVFNAMLDANAHVAKAKTTLEMLNS
ncbi:peroxiredoxin [Synechococcus sp. UW140]|jgi:peroxiredoxin Q/BCP|uniref:peroxiredoxin n=1 Tax=Synechococcus TaxID=1129 RepID=UPI00235725F2|nr:peroxiredoxin [Synechococcus sp. UW140]